MKHSLSALLFQIFDSENFLYEIFQSLIIIWEFLRIEHFSCIMEGKVKGQGVTDACMVVDTKYILDNDEGEFQGESRK